MEHGERVKERAPDLRLARGLIQLTVRLGVEELAVTAQEACADALWRLTSELDRRLQYGLRHRLATKRREPKAELRVRRL